MRSTKFSTLAIAVLAIVAVASSDFAFARGGGGGGGRGGRAPTPKSGATGGKSVGGSKSAKDKNKKDLEGARERLRQADYRGRDSGRDRGAV